MFSDNQRFIYRKIYKVSLRKFAQLSSADAVFLATNRRTTVHIIGKYRPLPLWRTLEVCALCGASIRLLSCNPSLCLFLLCGRHCPVEMHSTDEVTRREVKMEKNCHLGICSLWR